MIDIKSGDYVNDLIKQVRESHTLEEDAIKAFQELFQKLSELELIDTHSGLQVK